MNIATYISVHTTSGRIVFEPLGPFLVVTRKLGIVSKCNCSKIDFLSNKTRLANMLVVKGVWNMLYLGL